MRLLRLYWLEEAKEWEWKNISDWAVNGLSLSNEILDEIFWDNKWKTRVKWDQHHLGELFDFYTDVVKPCDLFRLSDMDKFENPLPINEVILQTKDEDALHKQIEHSLANLMWQNRKAIRKLASKLLEK